jgi:hypothetical protein
MKHQAFKTFVAFAFAAALAGNIGIADDTQTSANKAKTKPGTADTEEMMKKMEVAGTPGAPHKALDALVGEWNAEAKFWMTPDAPPSECKGTATVRSIHDGRFVQEEFSGDFMGQPFKGLGITGYDNMKKKYVSTWTDNMSTAIMTTEGTADSSGKKFTFHGKADCPITGEKDKVTKCILRIDSPTKHTFEMHDPSLGDKSKTGEIVYTRK